MVAVLVLLAAGAAAALLLTMPTVQQVTPDDVTRDATPRLQLQIARPLGIDADAVSATVDGDAVAADAVRVLDGGALVTIQAPRLADGEHRARVEIAGVGVLQRTLTRDWTFTVDTTPPAARIVAPVDERSEPSAYAAEGVAVVTRLPLRVTVAAEPGSSVRVSSDRSGVDAVESDASDVQRRSVSLQLPQGSQSLVVTVRDRAGNVSERRRKVLVDTAGPTLALRSTRVVKDATLALPISTRDPHGATLTVLLDGHEQQDAIEVAAQTDAPYPDAAAPAADASEAATSEDDTVVAATTDEQPTDADAADSGEELLPVSIRGALQLDEPAYEGRHALEVRATNSLGNTRTLKRTLIVNSGESLGDVTGLRPGARGNDVLELHDALVNAKVATRAQLAQDARSRTYGNQTRKAVQAFQSQRGMDADGIAGPDTVAGLTLKIVVDRSRNTLTLYRLGNVVKTWGVATGSSQYPTPPGSFEIQSMQRDPTWTPPDLPWAKDAKPIAPGPDNPLGTRWMAVNGTVGIHGTNNPASIGYSVSHGCIRMRIPDVEELFDMVSIGTPVTIV